MRALAWLVVLGVAALILGHIYYTLLVFGVAAAISYLLYPWVRWVHEGKAPVIGRPVPWLAAVLLVCATIPILLTIIGFIAAPAIGEQVTILSTNLPQQAVRVQTAFDWNTWDRRLKRIHIPEPVRLQLKTLFQRQVTRLFESLSDVVSGVANFLYAALTWLLFLIMSGIVSLFMLLQLPSTADQFREAIPEAYRGDVNTLLHEINVVFGGFVKGTAILALIDAAATFILLSGLALPAVLGVPGFVPYQYAVVIGLLALVGYPIPIVGMAGVSLVAALVAYMQGGGALYVATVALIVVLTATSVDRFISPRLMSNAMGVSPLFVMFAACAGAELMGFWGALLGVPVAAALKIVFRFVNQRFLRAGGPPALPRREETLLVPALSEPAPAEEAARL